LREAKSLCLIALGGLGKTKGTARALCRAGKGGKDFRGGGRRQGFEKGCAFENFFSSSKKKGGNGRASEAHAAKREGVKEAHRRNFGLATIEKWGKGSASRRGGKSRYFLLDLKGENAGTNAQRFPE